MFVAEMIEEQNIEMTGTAAVNATIVVSDPQVVWTTAWEHPSTFASTIRQAFKEGKLDGLIKRAEADYDAGKALDTLD